MNAAVKTYRESLKNSFLQDIATFFAFPPRSNRADPGNQGSIQGSSLFASTSSSTNIDGARGEKVLAVVCCEPDIVEIRLEEGVFRLHIPTGEWQTAPPTDETVHPPEHPQVPTLTGGQWTITAERLILSTQTASLFFTAQEGLPIENPTCVVQGADGTVWIGSPIGVARLRDGRWRYFAGRRWLPDDSVSALVLDTKKRAWICTASGLACIESVSMTLPEKAAHYEHITDARHNRDGFVTECLLPVAGNTDSFLYEASDNDGLWTALYLCAECFRWAVTGQEEARLLARKSLQAMLALVHFTGISGFPARAILRRGERAIQSEPLANWRPSPVDPEVQYKEDTSSDEIDGHYLAWYVYHTLVADAQEKEKIAATCQAVTNHLLDHHYTLVGASGKRTSWGVWTPETLNKDPDWLAERGLNSLEILSHLRVAMHICPCERFEAAYRSLIEEHHYALNTVRQKMLPPDADFNHSDDELAACAYYPLLQLETEPSLRALYLLSLERTYAILRPQHSPFHNVIYGALTGHACDSDTIRQWLQEAPWDLRDWKMQNSRRSDVKFADERDRFGLRQLEHPLSPAEIGVMKWNRNPYLADWEGEGQREMDGAFWLLPYWMGRFHGIIAQ